MSPKERVQAILNREPVDRIPVDFWFTSEVWQSLVDHYKTDDEIELYSSMGVDKIAGLWAPYREVEGRNLWGSKVRFIDTGVARYQEVEEPGLKGYDTVASLDKYPYWPDPENFDYEQMIGRAKSMSQHFATLGPWVSFFEIYCTLRGLEQAMMDVALAPDYVQAALDRIEQIQTEMLKKYLSQAAEYTDMVFISDDMGSQNGLMMSFGMWDDFFKSRMERFCSLIHSYDIKVFYHSDGACEPLLERLIDTGIDVLNPIQHICPGMDMTSLKDKYGNRLIFHGAVDTQDVLPFGDTEKVRQETLDCLNTLGRDKQGYICCSCHNIQAGTPVENIFEMVKTVIES